jgi:hypothetical protein
MLKLDGKGTTLAAIIGTMLQEKNALPSIIESLNL